MRFIAGALTFAYFVGASTAFSVGINNPRLTITRPAYSFESASTTALSMIESDFPSAMPAQPEMTMTEKLIDSATVYIDRIESQMGEGVSPPPEIEALRAARDDGDPTKVTSVMYELMIEVGMTYDQDPETGTLTPTEWDIKENLEIPEVKREFALLYDYGMKLISRGMLDVDTCKDIVMTRLIARTGQTPEDFDAWLGY